MIWGRGWMTGIPKGLPRLPNGGRLRLWGLGLAPNVQGGNTYLLHDGRAHSIEQAIEMHGGEAAVSEGRFANLSASDKAALITFLKSL